MLKGMLIHIVIAFSRFISQFGLLLTRNFTNFKQVVFNTVVIPFLEKLTEEVKEEISLRQTTNFKNNSKTV